MLILDDGNEIDGFHWHVLLRSIVHRYFSKFGNAIVDFEGIAAVKQLQQNQLKMGEDFIQEELVQGVIIDV